MYRNLSEKNKLKFYSQILFRHLELCILICKIIKFGAFELLN